MRESERLHSLDAVRAFALLAGIVLHEAWPFLPGLATTSWSLADRSTSVTLAVIFYTVHTFRMPLFFLLAGFFGRYLLHSRGLTSFVRNRTIRIAVPLLIGWSVLYPIIFAAFAWPVMKSNGFVVPRLPTFFNDRWSFPIGHLWFLYYLLLMYATALAARGIFVHVLDQSGGMRRRIDGAVAWLIRSGLAPLLLAIPPAASLFLNAEWIYWFGVATPDTQLRPTVPATVAFGLAFTVGWWINRQPWLMHHWEHQWTRQLTVAVLLTVASLTIVGVTPEYVAASRNATMLVYAGCYMTAAWSWSFAILGAATKFCWRPSAARRYIADASYWMYLVHLPLLLVIQAALQDARWHWSVKIAVNLSITLAVLFASYHVMVRFSIIGRVLNGRRDRRSPRLRPAVTVETV